MNIQDSLSAKWSSKWKEASEQSGVSNERGSVVGSEVRRELRCVCVRSPRVGLKESEVRDKQNLRVPDSGS